MACSRFISDVNDNDIIKGSLTNDEIKHRIVNVYAKFVSDVDPDRMSDWLVQEHVISIDQKQRIRLENLTTSDRCRALLHHLFYSQHPRAFLVVRQALSKENHYLLEDIDNQKPGCGICVASQPDTKAVSQSETETTEIKKKTEESSQSTELRVAEQEIRCLRGRIRELENELQVYRHAHASTQLPKKQKSWNRTLQQECEPGSENLQNEYKSDPVLVQTIRTNNTKKEKEVNGLAILNRELFVVSEESSEVEVYDSMKFSFSRRWNLKELIDPYDLGSCNRNKCLYIFDYKGDGQSKEILRVNPNGELIKKWSTGDDYGRLSVADQLNIILTVFNRNKLNEYSPCGQLMREINLSSYADILKPYRAIKLTNGHFVVSHGSIHDGGLHRVCLVDEGGKLKKSFGGKCGSTFGQMNHPVYLAVDGNGFVMVADRDNCRVLLLNSDLEFKREILSGEKHALRHPRKILLDESNGRLFVADNKWDSRNVSYRDGQILIFDLK